MTTVDDLLKKNRFSKKVIYRIETEFGWKNYVYEGRDNFGQILMRKPTSKNLESLALFNLNSKVKIIKL